MPLTIADLNGCAFKEIAHYNGGREWFGYMYRCVDHPRLQRFEKCIRKTRSVELTWMVDGENCPGPTPDEQLRVALVLLDAPPVITEPERECLAAVDGEWRDLRKTELFNNPLIPRNLANKGLIEFDAGKCRLTANGAAVLAS